MCLAHPIDLLCLQVLRDLCEVTTEAGIGTAGFVDGRRQSACCFEPSSLAHSPLVADTNTGLVRCTPSLCMSLSGQALGHGMVWRWVVECCTGCALCGHLSQCHSLPHVRCLSAKAASHHSTATISHCDDDAASSFIIIIFVVQQATAGGLTTVSSMVHGWCTCKIMPSIQLERQGPITRSVNSSTPDGALEPIMT